MSERGCKSKAGGSASGRALMGSSSPPFPLQHCSLLLRWLPTSYRRREPLQQKRENGPPTATSVWSPLLPQRLQTGTKFSPRAAKGTLQGQQPAGYRCQLQMQEELHYACQACSLERKQSTSAGRKGSKGLKHTSCFLPLHWLQHPLHLQAGWLGTVLGPWVVPAPEDAVGKQQVLSSLPVPPQLLQHPFVLAVGSGSPAPTGLLAMEAGSFPTDTSWPGAFG